MTRLFRGCESIIRRSSFGLGMLCVVSLMAMMLLFTTHVIGRYAFNSPIRGAPELGGYLLSVVALLGLAYTLRIDGHICVNVVTRQFPWRTQQVLAVITSALGLFFIVVLIPMSVKAVVDCYRLGTVGFEALTLPLFIPLILQPLGLSMLALELVVHIFKLFNQSGDRRGEG